MIFSRAGMRAALVAGAASMLSCAYGDGGLPGGASDDVAAVQEETLSIACSGKCDGLDTIRSLWRAGTDVSVDKLMIVGAGFATEELNDALASTDYASLRVGETALYTTADRIEGDPTLGNLDSLSTGLAARFGESELTTEVNRLRRDQLASSGDAVFAESSFRIGAGFSHGWGLSVGGLEGAGASVGFDVGASLDARVIESFPNLRRALVGAPLAAARETRGFVLPRSMHDIAQMKPGELVALRGEGHLGVNLGVGIPLLVADPTAIVTYSIVLSAGVGARIGGQLDIQLVRLSGDQVVIDVGIDTAASYSARIAIEDGWGIPKLAAATIQVGPFELDAGRIVERALIKRLEGAIGFSARAEHAGSAERLTVARLRFSLDRETPELEQALAQALRGDVRLAQALAYRGNAGVIAELDLVRSGRATTSYAGLDLFGMKFFRSIERSSGSAVIQTPGGARALLFESLHDESGLFFASHGFTRAGLSGMTFDPRVVGTVHGEANLFLQTQESDRMMQRDKLLDHLDAIILALAGREALAAIEVPGNELERLVARTCRPTNPWDPCLISVFRNPEVIALRARGNRDLEAATTTLSAPHRELVLAAGRLRLTAQFTREYPASLTGPPTTIVSDYRLDDGALEHVLGTHDGAAFRRAIVDYLGTTNIERGGSAEDIARDRGDGRTPGRIERDHREALDRLAAKYDELADRYLRLVAAEHAEIEGLGVIGSRAVEIRFNVSRDGAPDYDSAVAVSIAQRRSEAAMRLADELREAAGGLGPDREQVVAYALLALTPPERVDLRLDVRMDLRDNGSQPFHWYREAGYAPMSPYARGAAVAPIAGGVFNVEAIRNIQRR